MPRPTQALIYDADEKARAALAYGFEIDGINVTAPASAAEVAGPLHAAPPEVVVVVLRESDESAASLVKRIAELDRPIPRLVLASQPTLPEALVGLGGPAGFLPLPAFVRDVVTAAKLLAGGAAQPGESTLSGALSDFGLFFVVRTMVGLGLSGVLEVERGARKGELRFSEGEVDVAHVGTLEGVPALHQLLLWEEAALVIRFRPTAKRGQTFPKGEELLEDCTRFLRDFEHATRGIGHAQSLFVQDAEKIASQVDLVPSELVPIMRLFDGHRSLGDVLEDSPFRVFDTLNAVARLVELGTIRRKAIEKPSTGLPQNRRPKEDGIGKAAAPAGATPRGPRSFRKKTGEHPAVRLAPSPSPTTAPAPSPPAPAMTNPAADLPFPSAHTLTAPSRPRRAPPEASAEAHGELTALPPERLQRDVADVPKVLIDLGPEIAADVSAATLDEDAEAPIFDASADTAAAPPPAQDPQVPPSLPSEPPAGEPPPPTPPPPREEPPVDTPPVIKEPQPRPEGIQSAEIDTGMRPQPPPELLEAPPSGPSILIDPGLVDELDAFELANSEPTPPPVLTPPVADTLPEPPPAPAQQPVVSFVKGPARGPLSHVAFNAAPTVPLATVPPRASTPAPAPPEAPIAAVVSEPAPSEVASAPVAAAVEAAVAAGESSTAAAADAPAAAASASAAAAPAARSETPLGQPSVRERRASGEFDALESEFFARESDLYTKEAVENFDDLDTTRDKRGKQ